MKIARMVGIAALVAVGLLVTVPASNTSSSIREAMTTSGCEGVLVSEPGPTGVLQVSASDCPGVRAASPGTALEDDLAAASKAVWKSDGAAFSALSLTIYRGRDDGRRAPRSILLSAAQLDRWFGPRPTEPRPQNLRLGHLATGLFWMLLPLTGVALCLIVVALVRSGRLMLVWIVR